MEVTERLMPLEEEFTYISQEEGACHEDCRATWGSTSFVQKTERRCKERAQARAFITSVEKLSVAHPLLGRKQNTSVGVCGKRICNKFCTPPKAGWRNVCK